MNYTIPLTALLTLIITSFPAPALSQGLTAFKTRSNDGKQERLQNIESYLSKISPSLQRMEKSSLTQKGNPEFRKMKKRIDQLEKSKKNSGECCQLVSRSNLPKMVSDHKNFKRKIRELEKKSDQLKAKEIMTLQAEVKLLKASLESLKKIIQERQK